MYAVQGTPVNINGRVGGTPGPAPNGAALRVDVPMPPGRAMTPTLTNRSTTFARQLTIHNFSANALRVRFYDDTFVTIPANGEKVFQGPIPFFSVEGVGAIVEWDATATVAA